MWSYIIGFGIRLQNLALLYGDFGMKSYSGNDDKAMKQDDEALNDSLLKFFRSVKRFIASLLRLFTLQLTLHQRYFFNSTPIPLQIYFSPFSTFKCGSEEDDFIHMF
jgi:hypothetical protein